MRSRGKSGDRVTAVIAGTARDIFHDIPRDTKPLVALAIIAVFGVVTLAWRPAGEDKITLFIIASGVVIVLGILIFIMTTRLRQSANTRQRELDRIHTLSSDLSLAITDFIELVVMNSPVAPQTNEAIGGLLLSIEAAPAEIGMMEREIRTEIVKRIKERMALVAYKYQQSDAQKMLGDISANINFRKSLQMTLVGAPQK